jgi:peptidyl-dipeptidase Dcp
MNNNPLLDKFNTIYGVIPFDIIKKEHFMPALNTVRKIAESRIQNIIENNEEANFNNTIETLEIASIELERIYGIFSNLYIMESNSDFKDLAQEISPFIADFQGDIFTNPNLFYKVQSVYNSANNLSSEEKRLLDKTYLSFTRNGALLTDPQKDQLKQIDLQLSILGPAFSKNVLDATNDFLHIY